MPSASRQSRGLPGGGGCQAKLFSQSHQHDSSQQQSPPLRRGEAIRTGFLLSQGGEFAFVLLSLAKELRVLPDELNRLLIIVVVRPSVHLARFQVA